MSTTCTSQLLPGPVWNTSSLPPAPAASKFMKAPISLAHRCCVMNPCDPCVEYISFKQKKLIKGIILTSNAFSSAPLNRNMTGCFKKIDPWERMCKTSKATATLTALSLAPIEKEILWLQNIRTMHWIFCYQGCRAQNRNEH